MTFWKWSKSAASNGSSDATINFAEGQPPASLNDAGRAVMAAAAKYRDDTAGRLTTTGTSSAYVLASNQVLTAFTDGFAITFTVHASNAGACTLNLDTLGARSLRSLTGTDLPASALIAGCVYQAVYNSATSEWILLNSYPTGVQQVPTGCIMQWPAATLPTGWLYANGQVINISQAPNLFSLIGTKYGGDGITTFGLPDFRGRVGVGPDLMGTSGQANVISNGVFVDRNERGRLAGIESVTLDASTIPSHTHTASVTDPGHTHAFPNIPLQGIVGGGTIDSAARRGMNDSGATNITPALTLGANTTGISVTNAPIGGGAAHLNIQPSILIYYIIKT